MSSIRLTGSDTITINGIQLADFPFGEVGKLSFSTDLATMKTGKNGNAVIAINESGNQGTLELRILRGTSDDKLMDALVTLYASNPARFVLMSGEIVKSLGNGDGTLIKTGSDVPDGTVYSDTYTLSGGVPTKKTEMISNVEGDVEQAVAKYTFQFASATRTIA